MKHRSARRPLIGRIAYPIAYPVACLIACLFACQLTGSARAQSPAPEALRNWFDDPFFALSSDQPDCPEPAGPRVSEAERRSQAHRRAEKGTTCWLAGEADCEQPSAYRYDAGIAAALRADAARLPLAGSSIWITVQGRVVYAEGCARDAGQAESLAQQLRALPHVQQVIPLLRLKAGDRPPYRVLPRS